MESVWICEYGNVYEGAYETYVCISEEVANKKKEKLTKKYDIGRNPYGNQDYCCVTEHKVLCK